MIIQVECNAKINIGLNILGKLPNGYHELDMIMAPIKLSDKLVLNFFGKGGKLSIWTDEKDLPVDENNIIYKIYKGFYEKTGIEEQEIRAELWKMIPSQAGLGGGSSDGAFFLMELNKYHGYPLRIEDCIEFSKNIGADIPFFLVNKTSRIKGIGEEIKPIENNLDCDIILIKPNFGVSTGKAYFSFSQLTEKNFSKLEKIEEGLQENDLNLVLKNIENHLEQALLLGEKKIQNLRLELSQIKKESFFMSGSGSCYYTLVKKDRSMELYQLLKSHFKNYSVYRTSFLEC